MTNDEEATRKEAFLQRKASCITHVDNHRIYFQPGDRYEKVLFHHCDLHGPIQGSETIHFQSCIFWGCRYFLGGKEVPNIIEAMGSKEYVAINLEDEKRAINAEGFRML